MKPENNNLENNISRLVKLAGDSNQPPKAFTDSLINQAIDELSQKAGSTTRERKSKIMTAKKTLKIFAYAAAILLVCGVLIAVMDAVFSKTREQSKRIAKLDQEKQYNLQKGLESQQQPQSQVEIEGKGKVIPNQPASAPATQEQHYAYSEKMVARALDKAEKLGMPAEKPVDNVMV